LRADAT